MMCFTDWLPKAQTRYTMGWAFIALMVLHLSTHMSLLLMSTLSGIKLKARRAKATRKGKANPQLLEEQKAQMNSLKYAIVE